MAPDRSAPGEWAVRVELADGGTLAATLTLAGDAWLLRARPVAADGRALGPAQVVVGWADDPGLAALLLLAGACDRPDEHPR